MSKIVWRRWLANDVILTHFICQISFSSTTCELHIVCTFKHTPHIFMHTNALTNRIHCPMRNIGMLVAWIVSYQRVLFTELPMPFVFPTALYMVVFVSSVVFALLASYGPITLLMQKSCVELIRTMWSRGRCVCICVCVWMCVCVGGGNMNDACDAKVVAWFIHHAMRQYR